MSKTQVTVNDSAYTLRTDLRTARKLSSPAVKRAEAKRLREAAEIIANAVRAEAARFSDRIPESIRVTGGTSRIYIVAGGPEAPSAYPNETGARHPLFAVGPRGTGRWKYWYQMERRPFLEEGASMGSGPAADAFAEVINDWLNSLGI